MAMPGLLVKAQLASKINILSISQDYLQSNLSLRCFSKTIAFSKIYGISNEIATWKTSTDINPKRMLNLPSKSCFSSDFMSTRPLNLNETFLASKTTPCNQEIITGKFGFRYLHFGFNCRAKFVDERTTDENTDKNEDKLVTKINDLEENLVHDQSSTNTVITYKPLNIRAIEDIIENVDKISTVYLTQHQREKFLQVLKSNLVAIAMSERADIRSKLSDRQRLLIVKNDEEREKVPEYVFSPKLTQGTYLTFSEGPDFRLSSIVLPDLMSQSKTQEKVEAQEIFNDRLIKITESSNENPQDGNANMTVDNNEANKKSD